jgi:hypothetical protein
VSKTRTWLRYAAIGGNALFVLWVLRNGINEGFRGTGPEIASSIGLTILLVLDSVLLYQDR